MVKPPLNSFTANIKTGNKYVFIEFTAENRFTNIGSAKIWGRFI